MDYAGILRAQLSSFELGLLFYNSLHPSSVKLKSLVERYSMLENLDMQLVQAPSYEIRLFEKSAYGDQDVSDYDGVVDSAFYKLVKVCIVNGLSEPAGERNTG